MSAESLAKGLGMAIQLSTSVRNARLDQTETTIGAAPILEIRSGSVPANCAAADSGSLLASLTLPSDWMAAAASGSKAKNGTWSGTASTVSARGTCLAEGFLPVTVPVIWTMRQNGTSVVGVEQLNVAQTCTFSGTVRGNTVSFVPLLFRRPM